MKEVTIYSTNTCHFCNLAKEFFKAHNVSYTEYNVGTDIEKRKEMVSLTGQLGVPVIKIGDQAVVGFQESRIASMLGIA
jgi:glutaredoxin 3